MQKLGHKLDKGTLLDDSITCESIQMPNECLNEETELRFALALQNTDAWEPFRINNKPVKYLKQVRSFI